ncbi:bifunctional folylpolyglutamate synthase/dihydrofolate synthase [Bacillus litorisediminis]|uniref:bifunctional folylpolyglutamate synthase/dihydrofolate synthase n=1 Tax=Bacillus litorisediminis TaxID=2922713 RepID=UPI001FABA540|nr:folylpolyglutamate synthase/dihydrofolate synthase family protein [Bacillus litorisediminis]
MNYEEALAWIHGRLRLGVKPGLKRMEWLMEKMGHPEQRIKFVHIGGTNGKGSTVTFVRSILQSAGYEVGTFTSPYIEQFNERISINGMPISDDEMVQLTEIIIPLANELEGTELGGPTEFEVITAMCLYYFGFVRPVDIVIMEVGLGGRFDSTNIIYPLISVITNIGMDHVRILGDTISDIAYEKAGIIKNGIPVMISEDKKEAVEIIEEVAAAKKAKLYKLDTHFVISNHESIEDGERYTLETPYHIYRDLVTGLKGTYQAHNSALAVMVADYLKTYFSFFIEPEHVYEGIKNAYWPGRFETVSEQPTIIIDGAHNREGIEALTKTLKLRFPKNRIKVLFAGLSDKPLQPMLSLLKEISDSLYVTSFDFPRAASAEELKAAIPGGSGYVAEDWKAWLDGQLTQMEEQEILVVTGSLYFISEVKKYFEITNV